MATQKNRNQDTYVGDRPARARGFQQQNQGYGGQGGFQGGGGGSNNMMGGGMPNMGNMGQMNNMGNMGGGMNPMAAMGNMGMGGGGSGGGQQAFDPYAMSQFFKQVRFLAGLTESQKTS